MNYLLLPLWRLRWFIPVQLLRRNSNQHRRFLSHGCRVKSPKMRMSWDCWVRSRPMFLGFLRSVNHPAEAEPTYSFLGLGGKMPSLLQLPAREEIGPGNPALDVEAIIRRHFVTRPKLRLELFRHRPQFRLMTRGHLPASDASTEASTPTCPVAADDSIPVELGKRTGNVTDTQQSV
jgi:hypothetical protein